MKKFVGKILGLSLSGALLFSGAAFAEEALLAKADFTASDKSLKAELWAEQLDSGYNQQLQLLIKNADGKIITAYNPDIKGGYGCMLQPVKVKDKGQQLMLSVAQGDWRSAVEYRIFDISKPADIKEVFNSSDNMGIIVYAECKDGALELRTSNGESSVMKLNNDVVEQLGKRTDFGGMYSITPYDADEDGKDELLVSQRISSGKTLVAELGAVLQLDDKQKWQAKGITLMAASVPDKNNTINEARSFADGSILPKRIVVPGSEATYPIFINNAKLELQEQFNKTLQEECKAFLNEFYSGNADMAFNVVNADKNLLSIRLICGKDSFRHHHVNINPQTGKLIKIEEILDVKNPDLIPLLELLSSNKNIIFEGIPQEWYIEGENLFFVQNVCGKDEATGYNLGNLHKYILDKKWLERKE